jgi:AcrR family transcriptional regulator
MTQALMKRRGRPKDKALTARRREEILDVATRIFAQRGYPNTDVQLVADELKVGKGTIYRYFPTKRDLFLAAVDRGMRRLEAQVDAKVEEAKDPLELMSQAVRTYLAFFDSNPEVVELLIQERAEFKDRKKPTYFEHREATVGDWQEFLRGLEVAGDLLYGTVFANYFASRRASLETQAEDILDIVFHGILTEDERVRAREVARPRRGGDGGRVCCVPSRPQRMGPVR